MIVFIFRVLIVFVGLGKFRKLLVAVTPVMVLAAFFYSCTITQTTSNEISGLSIDYLMFDSQKEAETAEQLLFQAGWEAEIEQGIYDDEPVFLLQLPQYPEMSSIEFINMEDELGTRFFPVEYRNKITEFIITFE